MQVQQTIQTTTEREKTPGEGAGVAWRINVDATSWRFYNVAQTSM